MPIVHREADLHEQLYTFAELENRSAGYVVHGTCNIVVHSTYPDALHPFSYVRALYFFRSFTRNIV